MLNAECFRWPDANLHPPHPPAIRQSPLVLQPKMIAPSYLF